MTLFRQLLVFISLLFTILFACTWIVKLQSTRTFLQDQLESHAQDTATSLGLSISPYVADEDGATVETMISVVFDRGYYSRIALVDLKGKVVVERNLEVVISDVPRWFIGLVELKTPEAGTLVTSGWRQMGTLTVKSHPGYAYKALWNATLDMAKAYGATGLLALLLVAGGLRLLLRPLRRIEEQAENLCRKQYTIQEQLPRTRELRSVVVAMNSMTEKVKQMFDEQAGVADRLRRNAYTDELTGFGNRRYLQGQAEALTEEENNLVNGALLLVKAHGLEEINRERGYRSGDQLLQRMADEIRQATSHLRKASLARLSGGTFAILLTDVAEEEAGHIAEVLVGRFAGLSVGETTGRDNVGHIGIICFARPAPLGHLLAEADRMLTLAQNEGPNRWLVSHLSPEAVEMPRGQSEWKRILDQVLESRAVLLYRQSVVEASRTEQQLHCELFSKISLDSGQIVNAGVFIPLAVKSRCIAAIDRMVLEAVLSIDWHDLGVGEIAVNISPASFREPSFTMWVLGRLKLLGDDGPRVVFEFAEFAAIHELSAIQAFTGGVKKLGHAVAFDHFGQSFANFGYLKSLQPKYVKIDKAFTDELKADDNDSSFFIGSLTGVAHSLDILVVAEGVETEEQARRLRALNVDGLQGYFVDRPRPVVAGQK